MALLSRPSRCVVLPVGQNALAGKKHVARLINNQTGNQSAMAGQNVLSETAARLNNNQTGKSKIRQCFCFTIETNGLHPALPKITCVEIACHLPPKVRRRDCQLEFIQDFYSSFRGRWDNSRLRPARQRGSEWKSEIKFDGARPEPCSGRAVTELARWLVISSPYCLC
jgi:hypothetical protein